MLQQLGIDRPFICRLFEAKSVSQFSKFDHEAKNLINSHKDITFPVSYGYKLPKCYLCQKQFDKHHWFYHQLCPSCACVSIQLRYQDADLSGKRCIVTGARVKIGYQVAIRLLRAGAEVCITTRFPSSKVIEQYASEPDSKEWIKKLYLCPISMDMKNIDTLIESFEKYLDGIWPDKRIDVLVNNAALTITGNKPTTNQEAVSIHEMPEKPACNSWPPIHFFPEQYGAVSMKDKYGDTLDLRPTNSWTTPFGSVNAQEARDLLLINTWAPFVLTQQLWSRLEMSQDAYVVNVHAKEGIFGTHKTMNHMHTNIAQAGFCMMTRCLAGMGRHSGILSNVQVTYPHISCIPWASRLVSQTMSTTSTNTNQSVSNVHVHGVDPGFSSIGEYTKSYREKNHILSSPIDEVDSAARITHVIFNKLPSFVGTWRHYVPFHTY